MAAKNKVIAGDYEGSTVSESFSGICLMKNFANVRDINKDTVESYEVLDETKRKSATSAVGRAFVGSLVLGPVGLLAGLSAKSKSTHVIAIQFKGGKKSLLEIDNRIYSNLIKKLF
ncbi:hypothetical protein [Bacillus sp. ISL-7]|uniref:hypothetical protein n=1 Tax=Bacillus sp. ISL-7 TaxID=2819136 RepID=UPI001BE87964|nr:hypothetical protein [Bacillus sp. ISL-7]MBT2736174.1 hypothetical protein [Bacillus sp. ISL-7]